MHIKLHRYFPISKTIRKFLTTRNFTNTVLSHMMGKTDVFVVMVQSSPLSANKNPLSVSNIGLMAQRQDYY